MYLGLELMEKFWNVTPKLMVVNMRSRYGSLEIVITHAVQSHQWMLLSLSLGEIMFHLMFFFCRGVLMYQLALNSLIDKDVLTFLSLYVYLSPTMSVHFVGLARCAKGSARSRTALSSFNV